MTHAIGTGTVNITANMPKDEARIHGRMALENDKSRSEFIREVLLEWYQRHNPALADRIRTIRRAHREIGAGFLLALFLTLHVLGDGNAIRRAPGSAIPVRTVRGIRWSEDA